MPNMNQTTPSGMFTRPEVVWIPYVCLALVIILVLVASFIKYHRRLKKTHKWSTEYLEENLLVNRPRIQGTLCNSNDMSLGDLGASMVNPDTLRRLIGMYPDSLPEFAHIGPPFTHLNISENIDDFLDPRKTKILSIPNNNGEESYFNLFKFNEQHSVANLDFRSYTDNVAHNDVRPISTKIIKVKLDKLCKNCKAIVLKETTPSATRINSIQNNSYLCKHKDDDNEQLTYMNIYDHDDSGGLSDSNESYNDVTTSNCHSCTYYQDRPNYNQSTTRNTKTRVLFSNRTNQRTISSKQYSRTMRMFPSSHYHGQNSKRLERHERYGRCHTSDKYFCNEVQYAQRKRSLGNMPRSPVAKLTPLLTYSSSSGDSEHSELTDYTSISQINKSVKLRNISMDLTNKESVDVIPHQLIKPTDSRAIDQCKKMMTGLEEATKKEKTTKQDEPGQNRDIFWLDVNNQDTLV